MKRWILKPKKGRARLDQYTFALQLFRQMRRVDMFRRPHPNRRAAELPAALHAKAMSRQRLFDHSTALRIDSADPSDQAVVVPQAQKIRGRPLNMARRMAKHPGTQGARLSDEGGRAPQIAKSQTR